MFKRIGQKNMIIIKRRKSDFSNSETVTLTGFVSAEERKYAQATGEFTQLLNSIQTSVKATDVAVRKAGMTKLFGIAGTKRNVHGEVIRKLDEIANQVFINLLSTSHSVGCMVSEESPDLIQIDAEKRGKYIVCFDPLDGSSNIDCLVSTGSIFAIYRRKTADSPNVQHVLQPGNQVIAAGYALYGSATIMVLSTGKGVNGFMLDPSVGEFILTEPNMTVPKNGNIYSVNEGYFHAWDEATKQYVQAKKDPKNGTPYMARYVGSMVADVHRTLKYGGIFFYPATKDSPQGKLRLLYECIPMAFIMEQAGGAASNGKVPILQIVPETIHQRSPIFLGCKDNVDEYLSYIKKYAK